MVFLAVYFVKAKCCIPNPEPRTWRYNINAKSFLCQLKTLELSQHSSYRLVPFSNVFLPIGIFLMEVFQVPFILFLLIKKIKFAQDQKKREARNHSSVSSGVAGRRERRQGRCKCKPRVFVSPSHLSLRRLALLALCARGRSL